MIVKELIQRLKEFDPKMEVIISDGFNYKFYKGDFNIQEFENTVDIGIGGLNYEDE